MELPFDCGCDNRREVMGAGAWQGDALIIGGGILILLILYTVTR